MARLKPPGVRLRVWRALRENEKKEVLSCDSLEQQRATLWHLAQHVRLPPSDTIGTPVFELPQRRKLARSRSVALKGELEGWTQERRCTAAGRKYTVFLAPSGEMFMSRVACLRSIGLA